jgi:hypothetical protein
MKVQFFSLAVLAALFLSFSVNAQQTPTVSIQKMVSISNHADADAQVLSEYFNALTAADFGKASSLLGPNFMSHGPSIADSSNAEKEMKGWKTNHELFKDLKLLGKVQSAFTSTGYPKGDWAFMWGTYSMTFKATNKTVVFPFHFSARIEKGKIAALYGYWNNTPFIEAMGNKVVKAK